MPEYQIIRLIDLRLRANKQQGLVRALWEPGLLAMSDEAVGLAHRGACIASKLGSYKRLMVFNSLSSTSNVCNFSSPNCACNRW